MKANLMAKGSALALMALLSVSCGERGSKNQTVEEVKKPVVRVEAAKAESIIQLEEFSGTILPFAENNISPNAGMRIEKIHVDVGHRVSRGQIVAEMDKTNLLQAQVQLENLKTDLQRFETLYSEGGISKQQLDQLRTQVDAAQVAFNNLQENAQLLSPISGVVTERFYDPGDMFASGSKILTIMQMDRLKVQVNITEKFFPNVKVGMPVEIKVDVYEGETFEGKVSLVHPAIDAGTRTFTTEITIPNGNMKLRPGMFCRVALNFGEKEQVVVSDIAVQKQVGSNERFAFVIEDGKAVRRTLTTGRTIGKEIVILSGIDAGETVVVAGAQKLLDGNEVEIKQ